MATDGLPTEELQRLSTWPAEVARSDLAAHFTFSLVDLRWVRSHRGAVERIGLAVQLAALRFLGYIPAELADTPPEVARHVGKQIGVAPATFTRYAREADGRTRRRHVAVVVEHAGWRASAQREWNALAAWLTERALEHDTPTVLFGQALDQLRAERVVRPGLDRVMRAVASARVSARKEIHRRLDRELTPERCAELDELLITDPTLGVARLVWLNDGATSASSDAVKAEVAKLAYLEALGAERLDLSAIPPERLRQLATVARRSTPRALRQMDPERRHPILLAALAAAHTEIVDETVRVFDMMLSATDGNARDQVAKRQLDALQANLERHELLDDILDVVLDNELDDTEVGGAVRGLGPKRPARRRSTAKRGSASDPADRQALPSSTAWRAPQAAGGGSPPPRRDPSRWRQARAGTRASPAARRSAPATRTSPRAPAKPGGSPRARCP